MIVGPSFVIATPTKTGAQSLSYWARRQPQLSYLPHGHRMDAPSEQMLFRYLMVRDPYARLHSIYKFMMRREAKEWGCVDAQRLQFPAWVEYFLSLRAAFDYRSYDAFAPSIWLTTLSECFDLFVPQRFWKLEEIGELPQHLGICTPIPHLNRDPAPSAAPFRGVDLDLVWREWAARDCEMFGYARLTCAD